MLNTVLVSAWTIVITLVCAISAILVSFVTRGGNAAHLVGRFWARSILWVSRAKVFVEGMDHIDPGAPYVYMANHQSMFDILALLGHLPVQFRWVAKKELFRIPIFGYSMLRVGYISIDRSNRQSAIQSLREAAQKIARGVSVVVFPEGTRSSDGQIKSFKKGGFYLATGSGRPIVPVVIWGTRHVMPKGKLSIRSGPIVLSINKPIDTVPYRKNRNALMEAVGTAMKSDLERIRANREERFTRRGREQS
jgi:1-acyl-sn-glycerol-3-phosphate acyltransferase